MFGLRMRIRVRARQHAVWCRAAFASCACDAMRRSAAGRRLCSGRCAITMPRWSSCCSPTSVSTSTPRTTAGTSGLGGAMAWRGHTRAHAHAHMHTRTRTHTLQWWRRPKPRDSVFSYLFISLFSYLFIYYLQAKYSERNQNSAQMHARTRA